MREIWSPTRLHLLLTAPTLLSLEEKPNTQWFLMSLQKHSMRGSGRSLSAPELSPFLQTQGAGPGIATAPGQAARPLRCPARGFEPRAM